MADNYLSGLAAPRNPITDALQGASRGFWAGNLGAPVDLVTMLANLGLAGGGYAAHKLGLVAQPPALIDSPVGGSDWIAAKMRSAGLLADNPGSTADNWGAAAGGLLGPVTAAAAPQIARGLLAAPNAIAEAATPKYVSPAAMGQPGQAGQGGAVVWHGTPHKFPPTAKNPLGEFDFSKIGTGEGAQAYGHGGYLADAKEVGQGYKDTLRGLKTDTKGVVERLLPERHFTTKERAEIYKAAMDEQTPTQDAARRLGYRQASIRDVDHGVLQKMIAEVRDQGQGSLYKVDLPDEHIAKMLDWDKPLSEQPGAVPLLRKAVDKYPSLADALQSFELGSTKGSTVYHSMWEDAIKAGKAEPAAVKEQQVAAKLRQLGFPGIRYLDGGSRGAGAGSSNYVVFPGNENLLTILERNGQAP